MSMVDTAPRRLSLSRGMRADPELLVVGSVAVVALLLAFITKSHHPSPVPEVARGALATLVLFWCSGDALARSLVPRDWGVPAPLFALPIGAATSGLVLTIFGFAHVPLSVSLWLTLAAGVAASVFVRRRAGARGAVGEPVDRRTLLSWLAVLVVLFCVGMIPAWRTASTTIYGENPDSQQVAGIAVLFQHVAPTGTDNALPLDIVPPSWRFRYPIFYALAGASNLAHDDPIRVFPAMAAVLLLIAALGFGAFAVTCLRAPARAGPLIGAATGVSVITLHLVWHPYWNQLWGLALLPYALLFGWYAVERREARAAILFVLVLVIGALAYPLELPYPLVIVAALAIALRRRPRLPPMARRHRWLVWILVLVLSPAWGGAAVKLGQGVLQFVTPHGSLWGGDVNSFLPIGRFVGTGGGIIPALAVLAVAAFSLRALPRRVAWAVGIAVALLCIIDVRFRVVSSGSYMDFKHLSFVGAIVVTLAATAVVRLVASGHGRAVAVGVALALSWTAAVVVQDQREIVGTDVQVTPEMFQIRQWASKLPPGSSVRVDVPHSGVQLWAVYMLGHIPVDAPDPVLYTTYAHARAGVRATYSLALRFNPLHPKQPVPAILFARNPPVFKNAQFVLRRIAWPARYAKIPDTSSTALVEP